MGKVRIVAALVAALLLIIVVLQNMGEVQTKLLFATVAMPLAALLSLTALFGFVLGLVAALALARSPKPRREI